MKKSTKEALFNVVIVSLLVSIVLFMVLTKVGVLTISPSDYQVTVNVENNIPESTQTQIEVIPSDNNVNLCDGYTQNYASYFALKQAQCGLAGGDWICTQDKAGCFDITAWDSTMCGSTQVQVLKAFCSTMNGNWQCTATDVGCVI